MGRELDQSTKARNVLGPTQFVIWFLGISLEATVVVCAVLRGSFRRYIFLNLYMAATLLVEIGRFQILKHFGYSAPEFTYFYFYSDALLTILLYFALISLYTVVFDEMKAEKYVRFGAVLLLAGTSLFTYAVVHQSSAKILTHFVFELCQNLYFVGLVLTFVLWGAVLKLRETRTRVIQFVLSLGVYFSAFAVTYALRNLFPNFQTPYLAQAIGFFLPFAWVYTFWRVPEEARLAPSRVTVVPR